MQVVLTAAGGGFRSGLGRKLFQTTRLCQSIISPTLVTNKVLLGSWLLLISRHFQACHDAFILGFSNTTMQVEFLLLGIIKGSVGLRGNFEETRGDGDTAKVSCSTHQMKLLRARLQRAENLIIKWYCQ